MKKIALTSLVAMFAVAGAANASGFYTTGYVSTVADQGIDVFDTLSLDLAVGYAFDNGIRLEADVVSTMIAINTDPMFAIGNADDADFGLHSVKVMYDFKTDSKFTPYVGAGITDLGYISTEFTDMIEVGGMFIAGVLYEVTPKFSVDLQYNRGFGFGFEFNSEDADTDTTGWSTWRAGLMYKF